MASARWGWSLGERSQRQPERGDCLLCSSPMDRPAPLQTLDFYSLFTMYQSMAKKRKEIFFQFLDLFIFLKMPVHEKISLYKDFFFLQRFRKTLKQA